jgi:ACR3 family arsenite transporter
MSHTGKKRTSFFERYLTIWVALCTVAGVAVGKAFPGLTDTIRRLELGDRIRSREAGIDVHLVKPVEPARLRELLASPA